MTLPAGTRLGPYEIAGPLGAGGMGEVYRARDTRLNREVAIKVLPADVAGDPDRLARFEREAKAVSALNHPNIATLYEVGSSDAGPYLVLERVDGQSLRTLIDAGPLALKRLIDLGAQIAAGLAKAHAAGIVHRDLKPDNVMVTADGFAKILDFGLARLVWPDEGLGDAADTATFVKETASGMILGTLGYLSPEQAAGKPADYRADQFALGALLYEMATGVRPFKRATVAESLTATIREEPEPVRSRRPDLPLPLAWLIERCLAKAPDDRYASTKDLARDLADIRDRLSEIVRMPAVRVDERRSLARSRLLRWAFVSAVAAALIAGTFIAGRLTAVAPIPSYQPLTFQRGLITGARFGPDGKTVYYSAAYGGGPSLTYVTNVNQTESKLLDVPPGFLLSASRKGELAILETRELNTYASVGTLAQVPALGGTPTERVENATYADWAADGERMAVVKGRGRCEFLEGRVITETCGQIRLSPVNDDVAFVNRTGLVIQDGHGQQLARAGDWQNVFGLAWTPDGEEVWFTASANASAHDRALRALSRNGHVRLIARVPGALSIYDVAPDGSALMATGALWFGINAVIEGGVERALDLNGRTQIAGLTRDGHSVLLNEAREVGTGTYYRSTVGTSNKRLGGDVARGLLPDGLTALVQSAGKPPRLALIPTGPGGRSDISVPPTLDADKGPSDSPALWSIDGRRLFILMRPTGTSERVRRVYLREGEGLFHPVTPDVDPTAFAVSPSGDAVAARPIVNDKPGSVVLYPIDPSKQPIPLDGELGRPVHWSDNGRLLLAGPERVPIHLYHRDIATGKIEDWHIIAPADLIGVTDIMRVVVSLDERSYVYQYSRGLNDLFLVTGLR